MPPTPRSGGPKKKATVKVPGSGDDSNRRLLIGIGIAAAVVVITGGLGFVLFGNGSGSSGGGASPDEAVKKLEAAGCTVRPVDAVPSGDHSVVTPDGTSPTWNTSPPTSGPHYAEPAKWGSFPDPLNQAQVVHNLEHGGIFIQYGEDVPQATIDQLQAFYGERPNGTLLAPLPSLGSEIAMGAWTTDGKPEGGTAYLVKCTDFDEAAYAAFFAANQFRGPERLPSESMLPGS